MGVNMTAYRQGGGGGARKPRLFQNIHRNRELPKNVHRRLSSQSGADVASVSTDLLFQENAWSLNQKAHIPTLNM